MDRPSEIRLVAGDRRILELFFWTDENKDTADSLSGKTITLNIAYQSGLVTKTATVTDAAAGEATITLLPTDLIETTSEGVEAEIVVSDSEQAITSQRSYEDRRKIRWIVAGRVSA